MIKLWLKITPAAIICLLLVFLLIPGAGKAYADTGYTLQINRPANGETITNKFTAEVEYTYEDDTPGIELTVGISLSDTTVPDDISNIPPQEFTLIADTQDVSPGSGKLFFSIDLTGSGFEPGKHILGVYADYPSELPGIAYMIIVDYQPGITVPGSITISFSPSKTEEKAGVPITLTWKVTGADSISIDNGVGSVAAEGSKPVTPTDATRAVEFTADGADTEVVTYTATYTLTATNSAGNTATAFAKIEIQPLTIDEIFDAYSAWGNLPYTWLDGSHDEKALVGPSWSGGFNNFWKSVTTVTNIGSYEGIRWDCNATQYRTLVCLNEFKKEGKLIGWDYMGVGGAAVFTSGAYWEHHAAAIWKTGEDWTQTATIFDPHNAQTPERYSVTDGLDSIAPWHPDDYYSEVYPSVPEGEAIKTNKYLLDEFNNNVHNRWGNGKGAKTPWQNPETFQSLVIRQAQENWAAIIKKPIEDVLDKPLKDVFKMVGIFCPANVLITNAAGKRLGSLADGVYVTEFKPLDAYYWLDNTGDQQWVFALLDGTYTINITGSSSGNFRLITYTGGDKVNDYGENPLTVGRPAVLTMQAGTIGQLTLADGTKVIPQTESMDSLISAPIPTSDGGGFNWGLILGVIGGVIVALIILNLARRKPSVRKMV